MTRKKATSPRYKSLRTLLKAFLDRRIDHNEYLAQSEQLRQSAHLPKKRKKS